MSILKTTYYLNPDEICTIEPSLFADSYIASVPCGNRKFFVFIPIEALAELINVV